MATIFTRIVEGEIPCYKVAESEKFFAFLDINPLAKGHTLVIPKKEGDYIFDIEDEDYAEYMLFVKQVALALKKAVPSKRVGVAVLGMEVPHTHVHLVPMNSEGDMSFTKEKMKFTPEEMAEVAATIAANM